MAMLTYSPGRKNSVGDININRSDAPSQKKKKTSLFVVSHQTYQKLDPGKHRNGIRIYEVTQFGK